MLHKTENLGWTFVGVIQVNKQFNKNSHGKHIGFSIPLCMFLSYFPPAPHLPKHYNGCLLSLSMRNIPWKYWLGDSLWVLGKKVNCGKNKFYWVIPWAAEAPGCKDPMSAGYTGIGISGHLSQYYVQSCNIYNFHHYFVLGE